MKFCLYQAEIVAAVAALERKAKQPRDEVVARILAAELLLQHALDPLNVTGHVFQLEEPATATLVLPLHGARTAVEYHMFVEHVGVWRIAVLDAETMSDPEYDLDGAVRLAEAGDALIEAFAAEPESFEAFVMKVLEEALELVGAEELEVIRMSSDGLAPAPVQVIADAGSEPQGAAG